jgi:hypothetical protein
VQQQVERIGLLLMMRRLAGTADSRDGDLIAR